MILQVENNPNCAESDQFFFQELGPSRPIRAIRTLDRGIDAECEVMGVEKDGRFVAAYCQKITDSGAGYAYLISGGEWGIRLRLAVNANEPWDLGNPRQWGEPFKIYGEEKDIVYAETNSHL